MGSWNETCALTKVAITAGEPVVFFVLKGKDEEYLNLGASWCEGDSLYSPVGLPLYGIYNDYGSFELDDHMAAYHQKVWETSFADNCSSPDLSSFLTAIRRGTAKTKDSYESSYAQMMVKAATWTKLILLQGQEEVRYGKDAGMTYREHLMKSLAASTLTKEEADPMVYSQTKYEKELDWEHAVGNALSYPTKCYLRPVFLIPLRPTCVI